MNLNSALTRFSEWLNSPVPSGTDKVMVLIMILTLLGVTTFYLITWIWRAHIIKHGVHTNAEIIGYRDLRAFKYWWLVGQIGIQHFYRYKADICFQLITGEKVYTKSFVVNPQLNMGKPEIPIVYSPKKPKKVILPNDRMGVRYLTYRTLLSVAMMFGLVYVWFNLRD